MVTIRQVTIEAVYSLHGGEPLMQPKEDFVYMLDKLKNLAKRKDVDLTFTLQTNATLVSKKWIY